MALITITGYPSSGKTTRAGQFLSFFTESKDLNLDVILLSDHQFGFKPDSTPTDFRAEQLVRSSLLASTERSLTANNIVIVDSSNELKSMRYQLSCLAKTMGVPHLVIHVATPKTKCIEWNSNREISYAMRIFDELVQRYEFPSSSVRWDTPLWTLNPDDKIPSHEIMSVIRNGRKKTPHAPTQPKSAIPGSYLSHADMLLSAAIIEIERSSNENKIKRILPSVLQRKKKEFIHQLRLNPIISDDTLDQKITQSFLEYVNLL